MKSRTTKVLITGAAGLALVVAGAVPVLAAGQGTGGRGRPGPMTTGTVSAVLGSTITLAAKDGTTYSVDASDAKVVKGTVGAKPAVATIADIAVGDALVVVGPISGTSITAKAVFDGPLSKPALGAARRMHGAIVGGTISAIAGSTLTIQPKAWPKATTTPAAVSVSTDASTRILKDGKTASLTDLATGEAVILSGTKNTDGSITATRLMVRTATTTNPYLGRFQMPKR